MRRMLTVLAGAALVVGLAAPVWAEGKAHPADQSITALGNHGGDREGGHHGGGGWHGHDGDHREGHHEGGGWHGRDHDGDHHHYDHDYDRGYSRHHYGYDRNYYGCGYYGCGYPDYYDGYYYGGGYGGRYYYDRDDDYYCGSRGPRYDQRCDCYHRDTRCDRSGYGSGRSGRPGQRGRLHPSPQEGRRQFDAGPG